MPFGSQAPGQHGQAAAGLGLASYPAILAPERARHAHAVIWICTHESWLCSFMFAKSMVPKACKWQYMISVTWTWTSIGPAEVKEDRWSTWRVGSDNELFLLSEVLRGFGEEEEAASILEAAPSQPAFAVLVLRFCFSHVSHGVRVLLVSIGHDGAGAGRDLTSLPSFVGGTMEGWIGIGRKMCCDQSAQELTWFEIVPLALGISSCQFGKVYCPLQTCQQFWEGLSIFAPPGMKTNCHSLAIANLPLLTLHYVLTDHASCCVFLCNSEAAMWLSSWLQ